MTNGTRTVGRYELRFPSAGGFAVVYRAYDPLLDRDVALKVLHAHLALDPEAPGAPSCARGGCWRRSAIPTSSRCWTRAGTDGGAYLAMELVEGRSLAGEHSRGARSAAHRAQAVQLVEQLAGALDAVHAVGLIHRDVKPENVLIESPAAESRAGGRGEWLLGRAVLLDLGIARPEDAAPMTSSGVFLGTPAYMGAEQLTSDRPVARTTDVYQLGATTYAALCGRAPFTGDFIHLIDAVRSEAPPPLRDSRPDIAPAVEATVARAMAKSADERYPTAGEFAEAFRAAAGEAPSPEPAVQGHGVHLGPRDGGMEGSVTLRRAALGRAGTHIGRHPPALEHDPVNEGRRAAGLGSRDPSRRRLAGVVAALALVLVAGLVARQWVQGWASAAPPATHRDVETTPAAVPAPGLSAPTAAAPPPAHQAAPSADDVAEPPPAPASSPEPATVQPGEDAAVLPPPTPVTDHDETAVAPSVTPPAPTSQPTVAAAAPSFEGEWLLIDFLRYGPGTGDRYQFRIRLEVDGDAITGGGDGLAIVGRLNGDTVTATYTREGGDGRFVWMLDPDGSRFVGAFEDSAGNGGASMGGRLDG
ncbi:MAG: serine/threonine-protein kinase [Dehalococcoidia bacterium]